MAPEALYHNARSGTKGLERGWDCSHQAVATERRRRERCGLWSRGAMRLKKCAAKLIMVTSRVSVLGFNVVPISCLLMP